MIAVRLALNVGILYAISLVSPWWVTLFFALTAAGSEIQAVLYRQAHRRAERAEAELRKWTGAKP